MYSLPFHDAYLILDGSNMSSLSEQLQAVDVIHAAHCLQRKSILITNDKHFDKISKNKIMAIFEQTPEKVKQDKIFENVGYF